MKRLPIYFFNSLTRTKELFTPKRRNKVTFYSCGPTVYHYAHIGNLRSYILSDTVKRVLLENDYTVEHIINITDVGHLVGDVDEGEDKVEKAAKREGRSVREMTEFYTNAFKQDLEALHVMPPTTYAKATEHIKDQIKLIRKLEKKGLTYVISDGVYFDTEAYPQYKDLLGVTYDAMHHEARIAINKEKKNPHDFALWKFSKKDEKRLQEWKSPWGVGFPGWHIECSAMALAYLGHPIDIHSGGIDHYTVHHPNEIAQAEGAGYAPFVTYWIHHEHVGMSGGKMAKSIGNTILLTDIEKEGYSALAYRYLLLNTHYRQKIDYTKTAIEGAARSLARAKELIAELPDREAPEVDFSERMLESVNDDLNIPKALGIFWDALKSQHISPEQKRTVVNLAERLFALGLTDIEDIPEEIINLAHERDSAREKGDFKQADKLRDVILEKGFRLKDTSGGTVVLRSQQ